MLELRDIQHAYDQITVLHDIDLIVKSGEIVCLLGESGSGKTTLLRIVAGLETGYSGSVLVEGQAIDGVPVHKRGFGLMFQEFALFPHLNVAENIAFGLRMNGIPAKQRQKRVQDMLEVVGLVDYGQRDIAALSGGEKQRVALARSLAPAPRLLMLDEPLGSLDKALKERLIVDLRQIIKSVGLTAMYVTHDQSEAYAVADRIAVMHDGRIAQIDTPENLYRHPHSAFIARFLGLSNLVPVSSVGNNYAKTPLGRFHISGQPAYLLLHPDGIHIAEDGQYHAILRRRTFRGDHYEVVVDVTDDCALTFKVPSHHDLPPPGTTICLKITPETIIPLAE